MADGNAGDGRRRAHPPSSEIYLGRPTAAAVRRPVVGPEKTAARDREAGHRPGSAPARGQGRHARQSNSLPERSRRTGTRLAPPAWRPRPCRRACRRDDRAGSYQPTKWPVPGGLGAGAKKVEARGAGGSACSASIFKGPRRGDPLGPAAVRIVGTRRRRLGRRPPGKLTSPSKLPAPVRAAAQPEPRRGPCVRRSLRQVQGNVVFADSGKKPIGGRPSKAAPSHRVGLGTGQHSASAADRSAIRHFLEWLEHGQIHISSAWAKRRLFSGRCKEGTGQEETRRTGNLEPHFRSRELARGGCWR